MILILLTILKIIGILFLVLLGLVLLLLCMVLFAPVRYRLKGAKHPDEMFVNAFISYLRPLLRVRVTYPSDTMLSVKILWFDLLNPKEKKRKKEKAGAERQKETPKMARAESHTEPEKQAERSSVKSEAVSPMPTVIEAPVHQMETFPDEKVTGDKKVTGKENKSSKNEKKPSKKAHSEEETENKLVAIASLIWQYKEMYPDVLGRVFHALKSILPRKCYVHLIFGTGSPDNTGYLYGAYCALQEYLPGTIVFEPVWMESYLDVEFEISGNVRLIHFVTAAVKIIADKRVRSFISEIRRL